MEILTTSVQKGGTGKTATALAFISAALLRGKRVLAVDLDPQGNMSCVLRADTNRPGSYDFLEGAAADSVIQRLRPDLDVIPANWTLSTIQTYKGSARRLQRALEPLKKEYDICVVDVPPTAGELQYNALQAATSLVIPLRAQYFGLQALYQIADTAEQIRKSNPDLKIKGFILTEFDSRSTIAKQMQQAITDTAAEMGISFIGSVRSGVAVREAEALQELLFEYAPKSKPAADYLQIFDNLNL